MTTSSTPSGASNQPVTPKRDLRSIFAALQIGSYRKYWFGVLAIFFGSQMTITAQSWIAYQLTHSPLMLTLVYAISSVPWILLSLFGGVIIDRVQKRNVMAVTQVGSVVLAAVIGTLIATGHIQYWHLLISSFLGGITGAFYMIARNAIIAELVPRENLYNAISLNNAAINIAGIGGPALAGVLIGALGTQSAYYTGIIFFVAGIIIMALLPATSKLGQVKAGSVVSNLKEGINYLRGQKAIMILLVMELIITIFGMCYSGLLPVFADLLNLKSEGYGFLLAATGIGATLGSLVLASLGNFRRKGLVLFLMGIGLGLILLLFANTVFLSNYIHLTSLTFIITFVLLMGTGITANCYGVTSNTIIQMNVPNEYRGRATSVYSMVVAFFPLANLALGAMAQWLGAPLALTVYGLCLIVIMTGIAVVSPRMRRLE